MRKKSSNPGFVRKRKAPKNALNLKDIKKGLVVVVHRGRNQERVRLTSDPRLKPQVMQDPENPGELKTVQFYIVDYHSLKWNSPNTATLTEWGVCSFEGKWAKNAYTVLDTESGR